MQKGKTSLIWKAQFRMSLSENTACARQPWLVCRERRCQSSLGTKLFFSFTFSWLFSSRVTCPSESFFLSFFYSHLSMWIYTWMMSRSLPLQHPPVAGTLQGCLKTDQKGRLLVSFCAIKICMLSFYLLFLITVCKNQGKSETLPQPKSSKAWTNKQL